VYIYILWKYIPIYCILRVWFKLILQSEKQWWNKENWVIIKRTVCMFTLLVYIYIHIETYLYMYIQILNTLGPGVFITYGSIITLRVSLENCLLSKKYIIFSLPGGGGGYTVLPLSVCPSFLPSVQDIFLHIFLSNCWWQKSDIWSQASYRYTILWVAFIINYLYNVQYDLYVTKCTVWKSVIHTSICNKV
jgi:hypothetical protein